MKTKWFAGILVAGLCLAPLTAADNAQKKAANTSQDSDMQRAIAFEHYKDLAAARQARKEAQHPTVFYNNADRSAQEDQNSQGKKVPPPLPKDK